jgi:hypothetical protein
VLIIGGCYASRYWCNVCSYNLPLYQPIVPQLFDPALDVITKRPKALFLWRNVTVPKLP